jgi:hypothetical protein
MLRQIWMIFYFEKKSPLGNSYFDDFFSEKIAVFFDIQNRRLICTFSQKNHQKWLIFDQKTAILMIFDDF